MVQQDEELLLIFPEEPYFPASTLENISLSILTFVP